MNEEKFAAGFHPQSKVWVYQSNRILSETETDEIKSLLEKFSGEWTAHKQELKATGTVLLNRFIILVADETRNIASGCSIDSSVKFIRELENQFSISLLDRSKMLFEDKGRMKEFSFHELENKISSGEINRDTIFYNNSISTLNDLNHHWRIPVKDSWIAGRVREMIHKNIQ